MKPLKDLSIPNTKCHWEHHLDIIFHQPQNIISAVKDIIKIVDSKKETCLQTNWVVMVQATSSICDCITKQIPTYCHDDWEVVYAGSRFTIPAESHYSPTGERPLPSCCLWNIPEWLYVIITSHTTFRVNLNSIVCLNIKELLAQSRCHIWNLNPQPLSS